MYTRSFPQYNAETYFPTEQPPPRQNARFSDPHENIRRTGRDLPPPRARPQEADRQLGEVAGSRVPGLGFPQGIRAFPKSVRILRSSDFRKVYDNGTRYTCPFFAAFCVANPAVAGPRVGFTTPRALGKAVLRNRLRRRVREAVRLELASLSSEWAIVFNPRRKTLDCVFTELQAEVRRLFIRCSQNSLPPPERRAREERPARSSSRSSSASSGGTSV